MPRPSKIKGAPPPNWGRFTPVFENLSDSDSEEDEEFIKHLFSDETLKQLESEDTEKQKNPGSAKKEHLSSKDNMKLLKEKNEKTKKDKEIPPLFNQTGRNTPANISNMSLPSRFKPIQKTRNQGQTSRPDTPVPPQMSRHFGAPLLKPLPTKFCIGDVVLDFGLEENSEPMHVIADVDPMPPPSSSRIVKTRRLPTKYKVKQLPKVRGMPPKPAYENDPPAIDPKWLMEHSFRPISPIKTKFVEEVNIDLPSSEDIWKSYSDLKKGLVNPSEVEWPLCCLEDQKISRTPQKILEPPKSRKSPSKIDPENKTPAEVLLSWETNRKLLNDTQHRNFHVEDTAFDHMNISVEEERAMKDWIKTELLNEPQSDIEEFDMLLNLARDPEKRSILFALLKPKSLVSTEVKEVRKKLPLTEVLPRKMVIAEPQLRKKDETTKSVVLPETLPEMEKPVQKAQMKELRPERPIILEVKDIKPVPPKPQEESAIQDWLQQCSNTISQQLQLLIYEDSVSNPKEPEGIDFENEISKEQMKPRIPGKSNISSSTDSGWQNSYKVRLEDFEDIIDQSMTEFRDPQAKRLRSKWNQQFGLKSAENLRRSLVLPPLPVHLDQCLQKIRILRRPAKRKVEDLRLRIEMKFCKMFCTLQVNRNLNLKMAVNSLNNAVYNSDIDVIQKRFEATQIAWVWANGTVMIINGRSQAMLAETQRELMTKLMLQVNFKADPSHQLLHLRLISCAYYPWRIALTEFSEAYALCSEPLIKEMHYVYYVDKGLPGVAARVHETGMIHVFAMDTAQADKMLEKLYLITANHRKAEIKVIKNEPI
uniref:Uncharacterized protein LOC108050543 n=1 Tax=Drosophila rhopaloa TaxID=1041015 RepID=A0A6P4FCB4_DRORH